MPGGWSSIGLNIGRSGFHASDVGFHPLAFGSRLMFQGSDPAQSGRTRTVNGTARLIDQSRSGTARQMQPGRCYSFDGASDYIVGSGRWTSGSIAALTVMAHVNVDDTATNKTVVSEYTSVTENRSWALVIDATETLKLWISDDGSAITQVDSGQTITPGTWTHVAATYDGSEVVFYIDGVAGTPIATTQTTLFNATCNWNIGSIRDGVFTANLYKGEVFDVRVWQSVQSASDIGAAAAMAPGTGAGPIDPLAWYKCEEGGTYATAIDCSGNNKDGTITAAAIASFHDKTVNDQYSFLNEVGFTDDTGVSGAYLPRDESATTLDTGAGALQYTGQAPHDAPISSPCLTLNGTTEFGIATATGTNLDFDNDGAVSLSVWVYRTNSAAFAYFFSLPETTAGANGVNMQVESGTLKAHVVTHDGSTALTGAAITINTWVHCCLTYDGTTAKLYANGTEVASSARSLGTGIKHASGEINLGRFGTGGNYFQGRLADARIYSTGLSAGNVSTLAAGGDVDTNLVGHWPILEGAGKVAHNVIANENHLVATLAAEATAWANTQDKVDALVTNGGGAATRYASSENYQSPTTFGDNLGSATALSISVKVLVSNLSTNQGIVYIGSFASDVGKFGLHTNAGSLYARVNGTAFVFSPSPATDQWLTIALTWDNTTARTYIDGVAGATSAIAGPVDFSGLKLVLGAYFSSGFAFVDGLISDVVIESTTWDAATVAAIHNGTIPSTAWRWPYGDGTETQQGLADLTENGTPDRVNVPQGILPTTYGPGVLFPNQSLDFGGAEANSPYAQQLADILADLTYDQAEDDALDAQFARVNDYGDDRIFATVPALTGDELTNMQNYTS